MANCLIIHLSLGHSSFIRFTPRNSHVLLFHMPVIMLNRHQKLYAELFFGVPFFNRHFFGCV
jgi:hypothetical protein